MRFFSALCVCAFVTSFSGVAQADAIGIAQAGGFLHGNGALLAQLDDASSGYFSTLDSNGIGKFGRTFVNSTGSTIAATRISFSPVDRTPIPKPTTLILLGSGLLAISLKRSAQKIYRDAPTD